MALFGIQLTGFVIFAIFLTLMGIVGAFAMFARRYQKVPPDRVLVVYGRRSTIKVRDAAGVMHPREVGYRFVQGGGTFILPVLEKFAWLNLSTHTVEPVVEDVVTQQGVPLTVEGVAQIKIKSDTVSVATAAEQLLGKDDKEITTIAQKTLEGHIRGVCATLTVEAINADRAALSAKIQEEAVPDFERLGLEITTFTIKDIKDKVNYLTSLGERRTAEVKRDAAIGKAQAEREATIKVAEAKKDQEVASAKALQQDRVIGVTQAEKEGAVAKAAREAEAAAMKLKADAYQQFGEAAKLDIVAKILPDMTESMAKSLQNTEKVIVITGPGGGGELPQMVANGLATIPAVVKGITGQSVTELLGSSAAALRGEDGKDGDAVAGLRPKGK
jgi:flotillin